MVVLLQLPVVLAVLAATVGTLAPTAVHVSGSIDVLHFLPLPLTLLKILGHFGSRLSAAFGC
jgi:hypothetical protein